MSVLESKRVPTVTVCTSEFTYAATEGWRALGYRGSQVVEVGHPFGHLPRGDVVAEGARIASEVARLLTVSPGEEVAGGL